MSENQTPTQERIAAPLVDYDADTNDYPTECPHGVPLRFFADGEEFA